MKSSKEYSENAELLRLKKYLLQIDICLSCKTIEAKIAWEFDSAYGKYLREAEEIIAKAQQSADNLLKCDKRKPDSLTAADREALLIIAKKILELDERTAEEHEGLFKEAKPKIKEYALKLLK